MKRVKHNPERLLLVRIAVTEAPPLRRRQERGPPL